MKQIACPVALHLDGSPRRIAALIHPGTGLRLTTGDIVEGQNSHAVAAQKLYAQSSLETRATLLIGQSSKINPDEVWHFILCRLAPPLRDTWQHLDAASGQLLKFSWLPLDVPTDLAPHDQRALDWLRATL